LRFQIACVVVSCFVLYGNTLKNLFALDDGLVLTDNKYVQSGLSGIPDILLHDSYHGAIGESGTLTGGRYRPLELVLFAVEKELFGNVAAVYHFFNVFYFTLTCIVLLVLLRRHLLPGRPVLSFIAVLLFVAHPIHTEAVANVKSRDEILSLLFLLLTLLSLLHFIRTRQAWARALALLSYLLALFSKENGLVFVALIPLTLYFFANQRLKQVLRQSAPFWLVAAVYLLVRLSIVGFHQQQTHQVMDSPYALATAAQKCATIIFVMLKYLQLLVFPHPLTYDYSFNHIPYHDFADSWVVFSVIIHLALIAYAAIQTPKKEFLAYCIWFYLASLFLVSNLVVNIGAPMGERFLFQPSVAFCLAVCVLVDRLLTCLRASPKARAAIVTALVVPCCVAQSVIVISRNQVWRTGAGLALHDVAISAESARANTFAGVNLMSMSDSAPDQAIRAKLLRQAIAHFEKASAISPDYIDPYIDRGVAYSKLDDVDAAAAAWKRAAAINPKSGRVLTDFKWVSEKYLARGLQAGADKRTAQAIEYFQTALQYDGANAKIWYNLGGAHFTLRHYDTARTCWNQALNLNPNDARTRQGLQALDSLQK
jgi:tetratricopeptide (TPR) repeat protein